LLTDIAVLVGRSLPLSILVKATVVLASVLLLSRVCRRSRASARHLLFALAFVVLLVLPVTSAVMPPVVVTVPLRPNVVDTHTTAIQRSPDRSEESRIAGSWSSAVAFRAGSMSIQSLLIALWLVGSLLFVMPVVTGIWQLARLRKRGVPWEAGQTLVDQWVIERRIGRRVTVLQAAGIDGFFGCGALRPVILVPGDVAEWHRDDLRRAFIHELEHVRRLDWLILLLSRAVSVLYWFHPLVWAACRRLRLEAERACDDAVLVGDNAAEYASLLLKVAERNPTATGHPLLAMASRGDLSHRVTAILDRTQPRGRVEPRLIAVGLALAFAALSTMSPLVTVAALGSSQAVSGQRSTIRMRLPAFDVASVKANRSGEIGGRMGPQPADGSFTASNIPLRDLVQFAYDYPQQQIEGLPGWALAERFDIVAKGDATTPEAPVAGLDGIALRLRTLLAERFMLETHMETRQAPVYELRLDRADGRLGPHLTHVDREDCRAMSSGRKPTAEQERPNAPRCGIGTGNGFIGAGGVPLGRFAEALGRLLDRPVSDRTGLTGTFDAVLAFSPEGTLELLVPPGTQPRPDPNAPSIFTALREQLGLRLDSGRGAVDVLVVDSAQRPTPD
jgi:uncharacterized protein (TIGR03435 family)